MSKKLQGKVAIVTGASKGIGASIAKDLAFEGASVVVNYSSSKQGADRVVEEIKKNGGRAMAIQANIGKEEDIKRLFRDTKNAYGKIDILVNNAGIYEFAPLESITKEHFNKMFDLNVLGLIFAIREAVDYFGMDGGSIINISSVAGKSPLPNTSVYSATKAAVDAVTKALSKELGTKNIRINSVNPGLIETEGTHTGGIMGGELAAEIKSSTPLGRVGQPDDVSSVVVFFASDASKWITGETLVVAGGLH